ncbi:MAG TPA: hypothetical protein VIG24_01530, partial [Acidimicrobiia bacterium]
MVAVKLQNFGGMIPAVDPHLLPPNSASHCVDAWVNSGALEGFRELELVYTPVSISTRRTFRIPIDKVDSARIPNSYWLEFDTQNVSVIEAPTTGDQFERFYWASDTDIPRYNTKARIAAGDPALTLGIPGPGTAPGVIVTGGSAPVESRAYVYTFVSVYGEEGPPSLPTLVNGFTDGSWDITLTAPTVDESAGRLLDKVRIYRTVSGVGGETDYFFVHEQDIGITTYSDTILSVTNNRLLESLFWTSPPAGLEGFVTMPNGIIAAWQDNEVWFCEPYHPHAWPVLYQVSVESKVIGCGVIGQSLIVCTEGAPFAISGINPAAMAISRLSTFEPCMSRGSIVSTPAGVAYASPSGLVLANPGAALSMTRQMLSKEQWGDLLYLPTLFGTTFNGGYYCFGTVDNGCFTASTFDPDSFVFDDYTGSYNGAFIDINDMRVAYSNLSSPVPVRSIYTDFWTGEVFIHRDDGVYWLNQSANRTRGAYTWRSKTLETPNRRNFEAMRVYFTCLNCTPELNPVQNTDLIQTLQNDQRGLIRVYADGVLRFTRELRESGEFFRLPSGFKATFWQIEIEARVRVDSVEIASTARELGSV